MARVKRLRLRKNKKARRPRARLSVKAMRKIARTEIRRQVEDKEVRGTANLPLGSNPDTYTNWAANNIIDCNVNLQSIVQGTGQGNRVGNKIRLTKFMLRGALYYQSTVDTPILVKMWVVSSKLNPNNATNIDIYQACSTLFSANNWFQDGNSSAPMTSNLRDSQLPVNTDIFTVYATRTWKVANAQAPQGASPGSNNDFKTLVNYKMNLLKYHPKILRWNDNSTTNGFWRKLFVVFQCMNANGSTSNLTTAVTGHIRTLEMRYEDI